MSIRARIREWSAEGEAVELDAATLLQIANALDHPQCDGAAQTLLAMLGDRPSMDVSREYIENVAFASLLQQQRLNATENENADLRRKLAAYEASDVPVTEDRRLAA